MLTISQLARKYGLSRTTVLYYEREGLLLPDHRSDNGYRWYGDQALKRLESIISYRSYGMPVKDIALLLDNHSDSDLEQILSEQFIAIEQQIDALREQQKGICALLGKVPMLKQHKLNKQRWMEVCHAAGFDDETLNNWHRQFEKVQPEAHEQFLVALQIDPQEIKKIRDWSKT